MKKNDKYHFKNKKKLRDSIKREEEDVDLSYKVQDKSKWQVLVNMVMRHGFHKMYRIPGLYED